MHRDSVHPLPVSLGEGKLMRVNSLASRWWWRLLLVGVWAWWVLAFWPGQLEVDALAQIVQGRTGAYSNWHPPLMAWLVGVMDQGRWGARIPTLLMITVYCMSWGFLSWRIPARGTSTVLSVIGLLWPAYWAVLGQLWKDVWMAMGLLGAVASAWVLAPRWQGGALVVVFTGGCGAALLRHNGITATLPLLVVMMVGLTDRQQPRWPWRWGGVVAVALAHVASVSVLSWGVSVALRVEETFPQQQIFLLDLAGISAGVGRNLYPLPPNSKVPVAKIQHAYYQSDTREVDSLVGPHAPLKWVEDDAAVKALAAAWRAAIWRYPGQYLRHRAWLYARQLALIGPDVCYPYEPDSEYRSYTPTAAWHELAYTPGWVGRAVWAGLTDLDPLFAGWPYLLLCAAVSGVYLVVRPIPVFAGAVSLSGLSYGLAYFFVSVSCEYRYYYWMAIAAGLGLVLLLVETKTAHETEPEGSGATSTSKGGRTYATRFPVK